MKKIISLVLSAIAILALIGLIIIFILHYVIFPNTATFIVENTGNETIETLEITLYSYEPRGSQYLNRILPDEKRELKWDISGLSSDDGTFRFRLIKDEQTVAEKTKGYITNGLIQDREYIIEINNNELNVELGG
jgi:hypothetical protein